MSINDGSSMESMEEDFAEAVERLLRGEALDKIVASYSPEIRSELGQMLAIVELAEQLAIQPVPQPNVVRRDTARAAFLQMAATKRAELSEGLLVSPAIPLAAAGANGAPAPAAPQKAPAGGEAEDTGLRGFVNRMLERLDALFNVPSLRLAPLVMLLMVLSVAGLWVTAAADGAGPGNPLHGLREWNLEQQLSLAPDSVRAQVIRKMEKAAQEDLAKATAPDRNDLISEQNTRQIYYGEEGNLLKIGPFFVRPGYQENANEDTLTAMVQRGELVPGVTVDLVYRTLPGNPAVVQGVSLSVVDGPKATPEPTAQPTVSPNCQIEVPRGWVPYGVRSDDTLESLAARSNTSVERIQTVNCINQLGDKRTIMLPSAIYPPGKTVREPGPGEESAPTATPVLVYTPAPPAEYEPGEDYPTSEPDEPPGGVTPVPTEDEPGVPTEAPTGVATDSPTGVATDVPTEAPTGVATDVPTGVPTDSPTDVPTDSPTGVPTGVPTDSPTGVPTDSPTGVPTDAPTDVPTEAPTTAATDVPTDVPPEVPTAAATDTPPDVPPDVPTDVPTDTPNDVPTDAPTEQSYEPPTYEEPEDPIDVPTGAAPDYPTYEPPDDPIDAPTYEPPDSPTYEPPDVPVYDPTDEPAYDPPPADPTNAPPEDTPSP